MLTSLRHWNRLPDLIALTLVVCLQLYWAYRWSQSHPEKKRLIRGGLIFSILYLAWGFGALESPLPRIFPLNIVSWTRAGTLAISALTLSWSVAYPLLRLLRSEPEHHPARRTFLRLTQGAVMATPVAALGYAVLVERDNLRLREIDIPIPNLPKDLDGLKLVQLTDIHMGPFLDRRFLARAVDMANETKAQIGLVTGDLISYRGDPLDDCLDELKRLKVDAGVLGCLGNHEIYADAEAYVAREGARRGMKFLREQCAEMKFGDACLNVAGVDYQRTGKPYLVGAERLVNPDAFNLLLSHNPDVFPVAARKGFPLTISGHTHGGQVRVEILSQDINVARFFTPYVDGVYQDAGSSVFVSRGIGTIGMPARLGAPPEVALIRLWRT